MRPGGGGNASVYTYPNSQQAAPLWFHDHTLGATRLNVYAGLAGAYLLTDPAQTLPANLPGPASIVPLVVQDRMFDTNGQLFFPSDTLGGVQYSPVPEHPYWVPEFVGDTIVVNGKTWPYLNVEAKRYRFLFLNGSNARTYEFNLPGASFWVIGTDGGYLDTPVKMKKLLMMPGERYDVIIDFAPLANTNVIMTNGAKTPFPAGTAPNGKTTGRVIQFRVGAAPVGGDASCRYPVARYRSDNPAPRQPRNRYCGCRRDRCQDTRADPQRGNRDASDRRWHQVSGWSDGDIGQQHFLGRYAS